MAFDDEDVVRAYVHRPPYPDALFDLLFQLPEKHRRALDLGCGPGKIAHRLASAFDQVDAVDPSKAMLSVADDGRYCNISWIHGYAETAALGGRYDLVTAGASVHWMDHSILFPRLAGALDAGGLVAIIEGDDAYDVPWESEWQDFLRRWLARLGREFNPEGFANWMSAYEPWLDVAGRRVFEDIFNQPVDHFIECQHSRATWSRTNLGENLATEFDSELRALLSPHATNGMISFTIRAEVVWGRPRLENG